MRPRSVADLAAEGFEPVVLPVRPDGLLDPDGWPTRCGTPTLLVSVMAVNNETGVLQDMPAMAAARPRGRGAVPHRCRAGGRQDRRSTSAGIDLRRSAATRSTAPRASARCMSAAARACGWRRYSPAAGRSAGCAPARCRRRCSSGFGEACRLAGLEMRGCRAHRGLRDRLLDRLQRLRRRAVNGSMAAPHRRQPQPRLRRASRWT